MTAFVSIFADYKRTVAGAGRLFWGENITLHDFDDDDDHTLWKQNTI